MTQNFKHRILATLILMFIGFIFNTNLLSQTHQPHKVNNGKGNLTFTFVELGTTTPVKSVMVNIFKGDSLLSSTASDSLAELSFHIHPGTYNIKILKESYLEKKYDQFTVRESANGYFRVNMVKSKQD